MKKILSIALLLVLAMAARAQEDYSFPVEFRGKTPTVTDFVKAISHQEDPGELLANIGKHKKRICGKDYVVYSKRTKEGRFVWTDSTEFCVWDYSNGRHKMVVMIHRDYLNGEIAAGQYSGLSLYVYDAPTRRMRILSVYNQGIESPEINGVPVYTLSAEGKTITVSVNNPDEGSDSITYRWDGAFFSPICL